MGSDRRFRGNAMNSPLFDMSQYQSATTRSYSPDWRDAAESDPAWDVSDLEPNLEARTDEPDGNAPTGWQTESEFTITLESGQTVQGNFIPCLEGEHRMHQFDFTGPVSTTGFKSRFVLAAEAEEYPHPCDYAQAYIQDLVARFEAAQQQQAKSKKRARLVAEVETPQANNENFRQEPAMAKNERADSSHVKVEVVEELSPEEEADRQRLELKVERAWNEAARALQELRDRRLYRNTHKAWEEYCLDRFGFKRHAANLKIAASSVFENLVTKSHQILPNKETQVRPLTKLEPEEQCLVWQQAVEAAGGKVPTEGLVKDAVLRHKGIVERLKEKHPSPPEFAQGDVVEIRVGKRSPLHLFNGMWGTVEHVGSFSYTVRISIAKDVQQCQESEMVKVDDEYVDDIKAVGQRIAALIQFELEPVDYAIIEVLQRSKCFTPRQLLFLKRIEFDYGLRINES